MRKLTAIVLAGSALVPLASAIAVAQEDAPAPAIERITVTAERRETLASKTPIALTVLSGEQLSDAGITDPSTLPQYVPNFSIDPGNGNRITMRGVTSFDTTNKGDPSAAFLLDGIYIARGVDVDVDFFDIARIEVLRGPQGTLYGRNSTAGVVNVISNRPSDEFEASINGVVGDFGTYQTNAMVNLPVDDMFSFRAAASFDQRDNYLETNPSDPIGLGNARNNISARVQGLITISDSAHLLLKLDYRDVDADSTQSSVLQTNFFDMSVPTNPRYFDSSSKRQRTLTYNQPNIPLTKIETWGVGAEFVWDLGPLELTYLGSHRETENNQEFNFFFFGPLAVFLQDDHWQDSHELRFATTDSGPFKAQFGAYYFKEHIETSSAFPSPPFFPFLGFTDDPTEATSYAVFGQSTYELDPRLRLTTGIRYTHDDKSREGAGLAIQFAPVFNPATDIILSHNVAETDSSQVTWRIGFDYDLTDESILYGHVSTGYKSGGFNDGCLAGTSFKGVPCLTPRPDDVLFYDPETVTAYEVGAKLRLLEDTLQLNAAGFIYDYQNLQLQSIVVLPAGPTGQITNAAEARVEGIELDALYVPDDRNELEATFTYLDAYYVDYFPLGTGVPPSFAGKSLDNSPEFTVALGYTYTQPITDFGSVEFNIYSRYSDSYVVSSFTVPVQFEQPSYTKTNLTVTFRPEDERWYAQLFAKNLEDDIQITSVALDSVNISEPFTFGLRAGVTF